VATSPRASPSHEPKEGQRCELCGGWIPRPLNRCRRRTCPGYSHIWAGDQRRKLFCNLNAYGEQVPSGVKSPQVLVSAVTAPGVDRGMAWDEIHCAALGPHQHSGLLGCRVKPGAAEHWNKEAPRLWRLMHGEAYRRCVREGLRPWLLTRVWELQKRGLLHVHPVLAYSTAAERQAADRYLLHLGELRLKYGFGYVERKKRVREPSAAAAYLSSYFVSGKGKKLSLEESVRSKAMPRSIIHISVLLTQRSGVTMRALRLRRYAVIFPRLVENGCWRGKGELRAAVDHWVAICDGLPPALAP
jgi:hypothetical protein